MLLLFTDAEELAGGKAPFTYNPDHGCTFAPLYDVMTFIAKNG